MSFAILRITPGIAAAAAAIAVLSAPLAGAQPQQECTDNGSATVCETPGNSAIFATPPEGNTQGGGSGGPNANNQNGSYGPNGNLPPVGGGS